MMIKFIYLNEEKLRKRKEQELIRMERMKEYKKRGLKNEGTENQEL